jgi:elongation factor G
MAKYNTEAIRAVALVGHGGAGKTSLAEALLFKAGAIAAKGAVEKGGTVCDFDAQEKAAGHSLNSALVNFAAEGVHVHLIDTPGYPDFAGQAVAALAGVETAIVVINAQTGIELSTERMMRAAQARGIARMIVINKIDADNLDLPALVARSASASARNACCSICRHTATRMWSRCWNTTAAMPISIRSPTPIAS